MIPFELVILEKNHTIPPPRLTSNQTQDMIKISATAPPQRMADIERWRSVLDYSKLPKVKNWGLTVEEKMMVVPARVLPPPKVTYANNVSVNAGGGKWDGRNKKFFKPGKPLTSWAVVSFDYRMDEPAVKRFIDTLVRSMQVSGQSSCVYLFLVLSPDLISLPISFRALQAPE